MTLLTLFNNTLQKLPDISKNLEHLITIQYWPEEKSQQAISIIQQITKRDVIEEYCGYVRLSPLSITLSPSECGIDSATFEPENILQADEYIQNLLADINLIAEDIKFSLSGHYCDNDVCTFEIRWEF